MTRLSDEQRAALQAASEALDWLHIEALNGVICTPPPHESPEEDFDFGGYNVEAESGRNYCASCKAGWRKVAKARAAIAAAVAVSGEPT